MDVFQVLQRDHGEVKTLLRKLEETSDGAEKTRQNLLAQLKKEIETHSQAEEKAFYPILRDRKEVHDLVEDSLQKHHLVDEKLAEIESMSVTDDDFMEAVGELKAMLEEHIEEEEREIFPQTKKIFSQQELDDMGAKIQQAKPQ